MGHSGTVVNISSIMLKLGDSPEATPTSFVSALPSALLAQTRLSEDLQAAAGSPWVYSSLGWVP